MAEDERGRDDRHHQEPWWWGIGPLGAGLLVLVGVGSLVWVFARPSGSSDNPADGYQAAKIMCVGLVLVGGSVLQRFRSRATRGRKAEEREEG
ncbi:hypothetical protein QFZ63_004457 [Streptomyces sp. B3I7]|uniref:hypothetical protein n=1 Tax=Streptomyces sp. B3I7 TaxID=3042269 RepID=UPI00278AD58D|nr:hypothetical protein [Streptomyces sp. B3I7]MDQ0812743.1 hypothetical protein [Streptomyces sp. B3I7]